MSELKNLPRTDSQPVASNETHSGPSSLWHEAYENKEKIASAALGAAAIVSAVVIKHTPVGRALGLARELLVIEDTSLFSHCIRRSLMSQGERVTILKGVESLNPFVGILENNEKRKFNLNTVKAAFVDGNLQGSIHGPDVTDALRRKSVFTIAMSTETKTNDLMLARGGNIGEQKPVVMQALREDTLRVGEAMRDPIRAQAELDDRRFHFNEKGQSERRKKMESEIMAEFFEEEKVAEGAKKVVPLRSTTHD